jgi:hypothetical protein
MVLFFVSKTVTLKGRVACEMTTCDELLATEIVFHNILEPLNPPEVASLLSALVFQVELLYLAVVVHVVIYCMPFRRRTKRSVS